MPITCPPRLSSGPPELPGLTAASNWISPRSVLPPFAFDRAVEAGDDAGGERAGVAERVPDGVRLVADLAAAAEHRGDDHLGLCAPARARRCRCSGSVDDDGRRRPACRRRTTPGCCRAPSTTWSAVRIAPLRLTITPAPSPVPCSSPSGPSPRSRRATAGSAGTRSPRSRAADCRSSTAFFDDARRRSSGPAPRRAAAPIPSSRRRPRPRRPPPGSRATARADAAGRICCDLPATRRAERAMSVRAPRSGSPSRCYSVPVVRVRL